MGERGSSCVAEGANAVDGAGACAGKNGEAGGAPTIENAGKIGVEAVGDRVIPAVNEDAGGMAIRIEPDGIVSDWIGAAVVVSITTAPRTVPLTGVAANVASRAEPVTPVYVAAAEITLLAIGEPRPVTRS